MQQLQRQVIIEELIKLIKTGNAHVSLDSALADLSPEQRTVVPENLPYSIWQLVDHIRITQWDIVEFCLSENHTSPKWPDDYWSNNPDKVSDIAWEACIEQIHQDRERFFDLLENEEIDLLAPFPYGEGQNIFREALLIADHTSYHLGEILVLRRLLKDWD